MNGNRSTFLRRNFFSVFPLFIFPNMNQYLAFEMLSRHKNVVTHIQLAYGLCFPLSILFIIIDFKVIFPI